MKLSIALAMLNLNLWFCVHAQEANVVVDSIIISGDYYKLDNGKNIDVYPSENIANALDKRTGNTIRSGGPGLISTILHRGMASRHIGILWSGFNIQSVVNGTYDVGLIDGNGMKVDFHSSTVGSFTGQASMAGALKLSPDFSRKKYSLLGIEYGSDQNISLFGTHTNNVTKNYKHNISAHYKNQNNRYQYYNGQVKEVQQNADFDIWDVSYNNKIKLSKSLFSDMRFWVQKAKRKIPATKTSAVLDQRQKDENYRASIGLYKYLSPNTKMSLRSAFFKEIIEYNAPSINSKSIANSYNIALDISIDDTFDAGLQIRTDDVSASFFILPLQRNTMSAFVNFKQHIRFIDIDGSLRVDRVDSEFKPVVFNLSFNKDWQEKLSLAASVSRNYTLPSFNDLYWPEGGNPSLEEESSLNFDVTLAYKNDKRIPHLSMTFFYSKIYNWIQWTPKAGLFTPSNQREIENKGVEFLGTYNFAFKQHKLSVQLGYILTDSKLADHLDRPELIGKRAIFIPLHKATTQVDYSYKKTNFNLSSIYYSKRYDTVDNSTFVPAYTVVNAKVEHTLKFKKERFLKTYFMIENLFNKDYENIRFYPMPLRLFRIGVNYKLN